MLYHPPSPQRKKEPPVRENKIRHFLKRSSEPLLNLQNAQQVLIQNSKHRYVCTRAYSRLLSLLCHVFVLKDCDKRNQKKKKRNCDFHHMQHSKLSMYVVFP